MRAFHILRLLVAAVAATGCAIALAISDPGLHDALFVAYALALAAANAWSALGVWRLRGAAIGFSYTLYPANLYGAIMGWLFVGLEHRLSGSTVQDYVMLLCLAVSFLFLVPIMSRFGVDDPPGVKRGVMVGFASFIFLAVASMGTIIHAMGS